MLCRNRINLFHGSLELLICCGQDCFALLLKNLSYKLLARIVDGCRLCAALKCVRRAIPIVRVVPSCLGSHCCVALVCVSSAIKRHGLDVSGADCGRVRLRIRHLHEGCNLVFGWLIIFDASRCIGIFQQLDSLCSGRFVFICYVQIVCANFC